MLAILAGLADVERDLIRTRTAVGRGRAKGGTWGDPRYSAQPGAAERDQPAARAGCYAAPDRLDEEAFHLRFSASSVILIRFSASSIFLKRSARAVIAVSVRAALSFE